MFVPFDSLPATSKLWIYQSERKLDETEKEIIFKKTKEFIDSWQSHGQDLKGSAMIAHDHFLILSVDDTFYFPSGCSIDKSVHFIQELEKEFNLSLLTRSKQSYISEDSIHFFPLSEARQLVNSGQISKLTKTFNNNIDSKAELQSKWMVPAEESWLRKYFKNNN